MKTTRILGLAAAFALAAGVMTAPTRLEAAPPADGSKKVQISCKPGWRGGAGGQYGGVSFDVSCNNGRGTTVINGVVGSAYSVRMGVESASGAFDCFFSGDAATVNETCVDVRLQIR